MDNKTHRSMRSGIGLLILSSLSLPGLAQAQSGPAYAGSGAYPPGKYAQSGRQVPPVPGPYGGRLGQGPADYGMSGPQGGQGMMGGPGQMGGPQGGPGQMGGPAPSRDSSGPEGGPAMAMMDAVARLDLTPEQRAKLDELRSDLARRQQQLLEKITAAASKLQELTQEQMRVSRGLSDLRGHLIHANLDTANRAEEMLTDEQRQALMSAGVHVMTPEQGP